MPSARPQADDRTGFDAANVEQAVVDIVVRGTVFRSFAKAMEVERWHAA